MNTFTQFISDHQAAIAALAVHIYHTAKQSGGVAGLWKSFFYGDPTAPEPLTPPISPTQNQTAETPKTESK